MTIEKNEKDVFKQHLKEFVEFYKSTNLNENNEIKDESILIENVIDRYTTQINVGGKLVSVANQQYVDLTKNYMAFMHGELNRAKKMIANLQSRMVAMETNFERQKITQKRSKQ